MKEKKKALILWKSPWLWNKFLIKKLSKFYIVDHLYINSIQDKNFIEIVDHINKKIEESKIEVVFFDSDYFKFINFYFINKIKNVKKILITFDDYDLHEANAITASACDLVITGCPVSVLKYQEKGYRAHRFFLENDQDIYKDYGEKKDIDVIFFGSLSDDRKSYIDYIEQNGFKVKVISHQLNNFLKDEDLAKLISRSKVVLNLSKSTFGGIRTYSVFQILNPNKVYKFYYQFKGRIFTAGLCGTACISEFYAGHEIMFDKNELEIFYTKEECLGILKKLLQDDKILDEYTNKFVTKVMKLTSDKVEFEAISNLIENKKNERKKLINIPYWYLRSAAKQIIIRNVKLSALLKAFLQFGLIFSLIKNSNYLVKLLIIFESFINVIWYSIVTAIKFKRL